MTAFTFKQMVSSFQPNFSKSSGGGMLWIVGTGFGPDTAVTLDGLTCLIKFVNYSSLNCIIPSNVRYCFKYLLEHLIDHIF